MSRVFVIGDIHGAYRALRQCLERSAFDFQKDHLICLGDVADGWPETRASIDELLRIKNLTYILGNHDWWTLQWMLGRKIEDLWYSQGGKATIDSYQGSIPTDHIMLLSEARLHYLHGNKLFVHAGIDPQTPLEEQDERTFLWDRTLATRALDGYPDSSGQSFSTYEEIYIGHTPVSSPLPIKSNGIWFMDTGAGWSGVLSMMDIHSKEMFISDPVPGLYPGVEGRTRKKRVR